MAKKGSFSKVYDKNGDYADVEAVRFDGTRTFQMQGDVTASQTWNGDPSSPLTLNTSIGAKKVTQDKIGDKAVGTGQMADGSVGLTQMDPNAMNGTVQDNDSKLATHAAVKTYVDSQISGQGTYFGKHTVAEINAFVTDNLHNGDRVMVSDSGTINLGPGGVGFDVIAGEDLILYKSGSTVQWDTMDGNFKTKQNAVSKAGSATKTVTAFSQNSNGDADVTYEEIQRASTSQEGLVQLTDSHASTSTTTAATPKNVKEAYDLADTANTGLADKLDKTGDGKDVTVSFSEASTRANIGTGEKLSVMFGKIKKWFTDLGTAAFKNVPASGDASSTEVVLGSDTRLSAGASAVQDVTVDGASVVNSSTKVAAVPNASTSAKGAVQLAGSIGATVASENNKAATEKAVRDAVDTRLPVYNVDQTLTSLDFNDFTSTGFHYCGGFDEGFTSYSHAPISLARSISWRLEVINRRGRVEQILVLVGDADSVVKNYKRHRNSGNVWSDWQAFVFESDLSSYELLSNKVSSWQSTPDDTHYPSEKLVKDSLDAKANASGAVSFADSVYRRLNETGDGWNKLAETTFTKANTNAIGFFDVYYGQLGAAVAYMTAKFNVRVDGLGSTPMIKDVNYIRVSGLNTYSLCIVVRGLTGNATVELWGHLPKDNISMAVVYRAGTNAQSDWIFSISKSAWTFYNYSGSSTAKPVPDAGNNIQVADASYTTLQKNIANPTNDNLVAMDANGLVKDSGLAKSSVESAITAAGTAIQGVKVNNTALTPDANKVVTVPLATTSADGAMSAADKTKLTNITEHTYSSSSSSIDVKICRVKFYDLTHAAGGVCFSIVQRDWNETNLNALLSLKKDRAEATRSSIFITSVGQYNANFNYAEFYVTPLDTTTYECDVYVHIPAYSIISIALLNGISPSITWETPSHTSVTIPSGAYIIPQYEGVKKLARINGTSSLGTAVGSASVPTYVDANGVVTPCTDTFVNNIEYVANQSGGGGNLNKTINGTITSVLAFMNDSEAVAIWNDAKTAAANAS